ncbi:MAG: adenosine deaminase [Opitutus sp.]|nr:adenosine deaminase [Opitutus sp.]
MLPDSSLPAFIQSLPKTETHLHVEGALPYELLHAWDANRWPAAPAFRERNYRYANFPDFEKQLLDNAVPWFTTAERYYEAAKVMFARLAAQNVHYVETSFHLPMVEFVKIPGPEIIAAIRSAAPAHFHVRVFTGMPRDIFTSSMKHLVDDLLEWEGLAGVDLHGDEAMPTDPATAAYWAKYRAAGLVTKCHAGEFGGAAQVREAVEQLGVTRVQHGVRAIEDPAVVRLCVDRGVTLDICPISNVGLKVVPSLEAHPLKKLLAAGVRCTLSTDDPLCFANTVNEEYLAVSHALGFSRRELAQVARNGWEVALLPEGKKAPFLAQLDAIIAG